MADGYTGEIKCFGGNFAPRSWAFCNGQLLPISQYQSLFSILGTMYGGDGRTTFALPDLRGRRAISAGDGPGLSNYNQGQKGGVDYVTLTEQELPAHSHTMAQNADTNPGNDPSPVGHHVGVLANGANAYPSGNATGSMTGNTAFPAGSSQAHNNISPTLAVNWIICLNGLFPSRG